MTRLRLFLKNSTSTARNSLCLISLLLFFGCSSSIEPTYTKENIVESLANLCKNEYKVDVVIKLAGKTLWIYVPIDADLIAKEDKPKKYSERFAIEENKSILKDGVFNLEYKIKIVPEKELFQQYKYNKENIEKANSVWKALRRVIFSMKHQDRDGPYLFCMVTADIKNGYETKETFYYLDIKKVSYEFISWTEYQHRAVEDTSVGLEIIGDKEGRHITYKDISMGDFIAMQIQHRVKLKFQKPEVQQNADIDKEILKLAINTVRIYGFKDFSFLQLKNLLTENRIFLNRAAALSKPID
ncbi:MAG: hypothetical protein WC628_00865 [Candidatus Omnitrophota bacterium]